jgi:chemotaxis protein histidine kinase CheA
MSRISELVHDLRARLNAVADGETTLLRALSDALLNADQTLLEHVRQLAMEHGARRGELLQELQSLSASIGAIPAPGDPVAGLEYPNPAAIPIAHLAENEPIFSGGDWRTAASNIQDELDALFEARALSH